MIATNRSVAANTTGAPADVATNVEALGACGRAERPHQWVLDGEFEEQLEGRSERPAEVTFVGRDFAVDLVEELLRRPQHVRRCQLVARAEFVVQRLATDPGLLGDLRHRDRTPRPVGGQTVRRLEDRQAEQRLGRRGKRHDRADP